MGHHGVHGVHRGRLVDVGVGAGPVDPKSYFWPVPCRRHESRLSWAAATD